MTILTPALLEKIRRDGDVSRIYTPAQWERIKKSLPGIDLDAVPEGLSLILRGVERGQPLRVALQELAWHYASWLKVLTPKQRATLLRRGLASLEDVQAAFCETGFGTVGEDVDRDTIVNQTWDETLEYADRYYETGKMMQWLAAQWQQRLDKLATMGSRSSANARQLHTEYWRQLGPVFS